jgi:hypothetical protein
MFHLVLLVINRLGLSQGNSKNPNFVAILRYSQKITPYISKHMPRRDFSFAPCLAYNFEFFEVPFNNHRQKYTIALCLGILNDLQFAPQIEGATA